MKSAAIALCLCVLALTAAADIQAIEKGEVYKPVGQCPPVDGPLSTFLPDDKNDTIFYHCSGGIPYVKNCPPGLVFNPKSSACEFRRVTLWD